MKKTTNHKEQSGTMKFNKIFIQLENQGIAHHYLVVMMMAKMMVMMMKSC